METQRKVNDNNTTNNNANHRRGARPSVGYLLFQYQSELTRRHAEPTRLSRTKIHIIDGLVSRTIRHLKHCSVEELQACKRELVYKEQLRDELRTLRHRKSSSSSSRSRSPATSTCNSTSGSRATAAAATVMSIVKPPPGTPPKPRATSGGRGSSSNKHQSTTKVVIFGPEIFV